LLDQLGQRLLERGHGKDVAGNHVAWCRRFILFHRKRHPRDMGVAEVDQFLAHVAKVEVEPLRAIAEARSALEFLYHDVLGIDLGVLPWPKPPKLLDQVRHLARLRHYSRRTEDCYGFGDTLDSFLKESRVSPKLKESRVSPKSPPKSRNPVGVSNVVRSVLPVRCRAAM
jgi:hypothetical protein